MRAPRPYVAAAFMKAIMLSNDVFTGVVQPGQSVKPFGLSAACRMQSRTEAAISSCVP